MSNSKRIVCLANSRMNNACCIVGRELKKKSVGNWIRITDTDEGHIEFETARCTDGNLPRALDILWVTLEKHTPYKHQTENWLIDEDITMERTGKVKISKLDSYLDQNSNLWTIDDTEKNTYRVSQMTMAVHKIKNSLQFVRVSDLLLKVEKSDSPERNLKHRAEFSFQGIDYSLAVTDRNIEESYDEIGEYEIGNSYITVGLTLTPLAHSGFFKLALAIIPIDN